MGSTTGDQPPEKRKLRGRWKIFDAELRPIVEASKLRVLQSRRPDRNCKGDLTRDWRRLQSASRS
ncbi:hypothetical protein TIFTF001_004286 [Ficus carica]|uniref:Uncharacterized protein n=1 Tax=Ficus carica TaxID=3494 RepID=A0AA87ZI38_FICCA|nr:hypothetical protein TIFTF001_004286 [Ficus carica]